MKKNEIRDYVRVISQHDDKSSWYELKYRSFDDPNKEEDEEEAGEE